MVDDAPDDLGRQRADLEQRVRAGEWLGLSDLAILFDKNHTTVYRWATKYGLLGYRQSPAGGRAPLQCDPADVLQRLAELRKVHRAPPRD